MPLRVIPVIDLIGGQVVRGVGGQREQYLPIQSQLADSADPEAIAAALVSHFDARELYVADLDAITGHGPSYEAWQAIARCGLHLLIDAGLTDLASAQAALARCAEFPHGSKLVIGLESLAAFQELERIVDHLGAMRTVFSLDLRHGQPLHECKALAGLSAIEIAQQAIELGIEKMIVLDLASVGTNQGISTLQLCRELRARHIHLELISGGGVRCIADLKALEAAGCNGALIASALHDGRITPAQLAHYDASAHDA